MLITCPKGLENRTASNIYFILRSDLNDKDCKCSLSKFQGVVYGYTSTNPDLAISFIKNELKKNIWYLGKFGKIIPLHKISSINMDDIINSAIELSQKIRTLDSYKIEIKNRDKKIDSMLIIEKIAEKITRKVDLKNPDKILRIEIFENFCGLSVIDDSLIIKAPKEILNL